MATKIPLKKVIAEIIDAADQSEHQFRQLYRIGVRGCRKFNMDIYGSFKTVLLDVPSNGEIPWPADYLDFSMLGIVNSYGEAVPLKQNQNIVPLKEQYVAALKEVVEAPTETGFFNGDLTNLNNYWLNFGFNGTGYIHLYGLGGGTYVVGEFEVDDTCKCFRVQPGYPYSTIVLEYLTDGYDCDTNEYLVDVFAVEALQMWVRWMRAVDMTKKYTISQAGYYKNEYLLLARAAKMRINKTRVREMEAVFRENVKLVARA